jgi:rhodanese-related sulfurtransferase
MLEAGKPVRLLDVRLPQEHDYAALPGSVLIPIQELPTCLTDIPQGEGPLVVYCHHGVRSLGAAGYLEQQGVENVFSLSGGIDAWSLRIDPRVPRYR